MSLRGLRIAAVLVGLGTVLWQINVLAQGEAGDNQFFLPDIVIGLPLAAAAFLRDARTAQLAMLVGFAAISGVFAVSTIGGFWIGDTGPGPISTALGLAICLPVMTLLSRRLLADET